MERNILTPEKIRSASDAFASSHNVKFDGPFDDDRIGIFLLCEV
jgi:hypothetical protein